MQGRLTDKALNGLLWGTVERGTKQVLNLLVFLLLARLLDPGAFGLMAILAVFISAGNTLSDSGFSSALIQAARISQTDKSSVFYFNAVISIVIAALMISFAPLLADFYEHPELEELGRAVSLAVLITALGSIHIAILTRNVEFKLQAKVGIISGLVSGGAALLAAHQNYGVWSLVVLSLTAASARTGLFWWYHRWRPTLVFSLASLRRLLPFGLRLSAASLLDTLVSSVTPLVVGKHYSTVELGYFDRADQLQKIPITNLSSSVQSVMFPVYSRVQDEPTRLRRGLRSTLLATTFLSFPMMVGMAALSESLITVLLTEKWAPMNPFLQLFCVLGILQPPQVINLSILKAQGPRGRVVAPGTSEEDSVAWGPISNLSARYHNHSDWHHTGLVLWLLFKLSAHHKNA